MRTTVIAGLFACVLLATAGSSKVSAQSSNVVVTNGSRTAPVTVKVITPLDIIAEEIAKATPPAPVAPKAPEPVVHEVGSNESLTDIANQYNVTWVRLFNKNENITNPDVITEGLKITIPTADEQLADRPLPEPPVVVVYTAPTVKATQTAPRASTEASYSRGASSGNTYAPGYCTWYAKNMRPDLPNNLGNAYTWVSRAAAQGIPTGSVPRAGAIGQAGNHVVYVESVNGDGSVNVSEMNYSGLYVRSTRTVSGGSFQYIY